MPQVRAPRAVGLTSVPGAAAVALTVLTDGELPIERDWFAPVRARVAGLAP